VSPGSTIVGEALSSGSAGGSAARRTGTDIASAWKADQPKSVSWSSDIHHGRLRRTALLGQRPNKQKRHKNHSDEAAEEQ
jgi:hypothetical protein